MIQRRRARHLWWVAAAALVVAGCSSSDDAANRASSSTSTAASGGRAPWGGFGEAVLEVRTPDNFFEWCVLVAATEAQRQRGLMDAPDAELGGYDGMLFVFPDDSIGGFWMKDTEVPLSLAYLDADGYVVSSVDMDPCEPGTERCGSYPPDGAYRTALEVPKGGLADLGVTAEASVALTDRACPAV